MNEKVKKKILEIMEQRQATTIHLMGNIDNVLKGKTPTEILRMKSMYGFYIDDKYFYINSNDKLISFNDMERYLIDEYEELTHQEKAIILNKAISYFSNFYVLLFKRYGESMQFVGASSSLYYWGENSEDDYYLFTSKEEAEKIAKDITLIYPDAEFIVEQVRKK